jgi:hypothetical protein
MQGPVEPAVIRKGFAFVLDSGAFLVNASLALGCAWAAHWLLALAWDRAMPLPQVPPTDPELLWSYVLAKAADWPGTLRFLSSIPIASLGSGFAVLALMGGRDLLLRLRAALG